MKLRIYSFLLVIFAVFLVGEIKAQTLSTNTVTYKITFDITTQLYTVWVVPDYNTPNSYNTGNTEKGPTAQTTLALPCAIDITAINDINGNWQKPGSIGWRKLSTTDLANSSTLDPNTCYYVIGKSATETDYGKFTAGVAVPLYSFSTSGCAGLVRIVGANDPFINVAYNYNSLNVANSFYSVSGQPVNTSGNQTPLEQFRDLSGYSASCSITAVTESASTATNTPITQTVLTNDNLNGSVPKVSDVNITITQQPTCGTAAVNTDGSITYTPSSCSGSQCYTYQICAKATPTFCSSVQNCISVAGNVIANADNVSTPANTQVIVPVLSNDRVNGNQATSTNVTTQITSTTTHGTLTPNSDGTFTYVPTTGFSGQDCFTYQICDKNSLTSCASATSCITVAAAPTQVSTDLAVTKMVNNNSASLNDIIVYTIQLTNNGPLTASNITVNDNLPINLQYITASPASGSYNATTGIWTVASLAYGATTTLSLQAKVVSDGIVNNTATLGGFDGTDTNASNNSSTVCTSVPTSLCQGQTLALTVPTQYTNVIWYKNGLQIGTGNNYTATTSGSYTWTASNNTCPINGCCPIVVISEVCCATNICIPVSVTKVN